MSWFYCVIIFLINVSVIDGFAERWSGDWLGLMVWTSCLLFLTPPPEGGGKGFKE